MAVVFSSNLQGDASKKLTTARVIRRATGGKVDCVCGTGIGDSRLRRIVLTGWRRFCQTRRRKADLESGGRTSPLGSSPLPDLRSVEPNTTGKQKGNIYEPIDSGKKSSSSICRHLGLLRPFADNASGHSATGRRLSRRQYGRGTECPA